MTIIKSEKFGRGKAAQRIDPEAVDPEMRRALGDLASSVMTIDDRVAYYADKLGIYDSGPYLRLPESMMDKVRAYMVVKHGMRHDEFMEMPFPEVIRILKDDWENAGRPRPKPKRKKRTEPTAQQKEIAALVAEAKALYAQGYTRTKIASVIKKSESTVSRYLNRP